MVSKAAAVLPSRASLADLPDPSLPLRNAIYTLLAPFGKAASSAEQSADEGRAPGWPWIAAATKSPPSPCGSFMHAVITAVIRTNEVANLDISNPFQNLPRQPRQRQPSCGMQWDPSSIFGIFAGGGMHEDRIVSGGNRMAQLEQWLQIAGLGRCKRRQLPHARHQRALQRALLQQNAAVPADQRVTQNGLAPGVALFSGNRPTRNTHCSNRTYITERLPRQADQRAQFHHRLVEVSGMALVQQALRKFPITLFRDRDSRRCTIGKDALQNSLHIAIHHRHRLAKRDAGDRSRGVAPNPGQGH